MISVSIFYYLALFDCTLVLIFIFSRCFESSPLSCSDLELVLKFKFHENSHSGMLVSLARFRMETSRIQMQGFTVAPTCSLNKFIYIYTNILSDISD
jgi:hypothetical protein